MKIIIAKLGLDGHDRGAKFISRYLLNEGLNVIYTGIRQTTDKVADLAIKENADVIGISILSGAHKTLILELINKLKEHNADIRLIVGGIIPDNDIDYLKSVGVDAIFTSGAKMLDITNQLII